MAGWLGSGVKGKMDRIFKPSPGKILVSDKLGNAVESNKTIANLVSELEEDSKIGNLSNLTTTNKTNLVSAINEVAMREGTEENYSLIYNTVLESASASNQITLTPEELNGFYIDVVAKVSFDVSNDTGTDFVTEFRSNYAGSDVYSAYFWESIELANNKSNHIIVGVKSEHGIPVTFYTVSSQHAQLSSTATHYGGYSWQNYGNEFNDNTFLYPQPIVEEHGFYYGPGIGFIYLSVDVGKHFPEATGIEVYARCKVETPEWYLTI